MISPHQNTNPSARNEYEAMAQINGGLTQQDAEFADYEKMLDRRSKLPKQASISIANLCIAVILMAVLGALIFYGRVQY